jgi:uncharacterized delta-60 repeat protein
MNIRIAAAALAFVVPVATVSAFGQAGSLDPTFGSGGIVITNFGVNENNFQLVDAALAPNGDIIVAGTVSNLAEGETQSCDIIRYLPSGELDASFGSAGIATLAAPYFASTTGVLSLQANGKILVLTQVEVDGALEVALERLDANGELDSTFGSGGIAVVDFPAPATEVASPSLVLAQPDGKILLAGAATPPFRSKLSPETVLGRYLSNGTPDTTFGSKGFASAVAIGTPSALAVLSGDGILALNNAGQLAQFTSAGVPLTTPIGGTVTAVKASGASTFLANGDFLQAGAVQGPDGRRNADSIIERFLPSGVLDSTFASPAISFGPNGGGVDSYSFGIGTDSLGRVIVGGQFITPTNGVWGVARVNSNGSLDTTFGSGGSVNTLVGLEGFASVVLIQPNNEIVAVGEAQVSKDTANTMEDLAIVRSRAE